MIMTTTTRITTTTTRTTSTTMVTQLWDLIIALGFHKDINSDVVVDADME